jgi:hypothetical protein
VELGKGSAASPFAFLAQPPLMEKSHDQLKAALGSPAPSIVFQKPRFVTVHAFVLLHCLFNLFVKLNKWIKMAGPRCFNAAEKWIKIVV